MSEHSKNKTPPRLAASLLQRSESVVTPISRRSLLRGLSTGALCLTLPVWRRLEAEAQTDPLPQRFFVFFTPNGTLKSKFFPSAPDQPTSSPILAPLSAFASRINVLKGVHMHSMIGTKKPGGPHMKGPAAMLSGGWLLEGSFGGAGGPAGYGNRISVDQELANRIGTQTTYRSLEYGVDMRGQEPLKYISYSGPNRPNPAVDDPWAVYKRIFANFVPAQGPKAVQRRLEDQTVLDYSKDELSALNSRLPREDRPRLEAHLEHTRAIERQLDALKRACQVPAPLGAAVDIAADDNYPKIGKLQMDLMFQAQACDLTRVSTFMWSNADSWQRMPWLGINEEHHALSHEEKDSVTAGKLQKINTWYNEQIAYFLGLLDGIPEGGGSLLDQSLVLCGNEIGQGNHTHEDIPWILAGSAGGRLRTGRLIDDGDKPHNNLLLTVLHAFGMTSAKSFGAPEHCTGTLSGLLV